MTSYTCSVSTANRQCTKDSPRLPGLCLPPARLAPGSPPARPPPPHQILPRGGNSLSVLSATTGRPPPPPPPSYSRCPENSIGLFAGDEHPPGTPNPCLPFLQCEFEHPNPNLSYLHSDLVWSSYNLLQLLLQKKLSGVQPCTSPCPPLQCLYDPPATVDARSLAEDLLVPVSRRRG